MKISNAFNVEHVYMNGLQYSARVDRCRGITFYETDSGTIYVDVDLGEEVMRIFKPDSIKFAKAALAEYR